MQAADLARGHDGARDRRLVVPGRRCSNLPITWALRRTPGSNQPRIRTFRSRGEPDIIGPESFGSPLWGAQGARARGAHVFLGSVPVVRVPGPRIALSATR